MVRWFLLLLSLVVVAAASLTVLRAPTLATWKVAILAGEYGQYLWFIPLILGFGAALVNRSHHSAGIMGTTVIFCLVAILLLLRPSYLARDLGDALPHRLDVAFGPVDHVYGGAFAPAKYILRTSLAKEAPETMVYQPGTEPLSLDFYRAIAADGEVPCIVLIHGGGWNSGSRDELPGLDRLLAEKGFAVAAIDYRLAPAFPWPEQSRNVKAALVYLKAHAKALGIDAKRLVLFGRSAGGQIATAYAYQAKDPAIRGVAAFYSPHDLRFAWQYADPKDILNSLKLIKDYLGGTPEEVGANYDSASAIQHVTPKSPPTLLVHGEIDTLVWNRQSERLEAVLGKNGVPHVFLSLPWATHAFDYNLDGPGGQLAVYALLDFVTAVTR